MDERELKRPTAGLEYERRPDRDPALESSPEDLPPEARAVVTPLADRQSPVEDVNRLLDEWVRRP
jgi:hypothetical protein